MCTVYQIVAHMVLANIYCYAVLLKNENKIQLCSSKDK